MAVFRLCTFCKIGVFFPFIFLRVYSLKLTVFQLSVNIFVPTYN